MSNTPVEATALTERRKMADHLNQLRTASRAKVISLATGKRYYASLTIWLRL
jgi:hypothetical protein